MAKENGNTAPVGVPMMIPADKTDEIGAILRVILVLDDPDIDRLIKEGESYETLVRRLQVIKTNLADVARQIRTVTGYNQ